MGGKTARDVFGARQAKVDARMVGLTGTFKMVIIVLIFGLVKI